MASSFDLDLVNLDYYKIFYEVAKSGSITNAANNLFISQPAITQTINKLEDKLGATLFIRQNKGIILTEVGKEIFEKVEKALLNFSQVKKIVLDFNHLVKGELKLASGTNIAKAFLTKPLLKFKKVYPNVKITLIDEISSKLHQKLKDGKVDLVLSQKGDYENESFEYKKLITEKYSFFCSPNYLLKDNLTKKELEEQTFILANSGSGGRVYFDELCKKNNLQIQSNFSVAGFNMIVDLVKNGGGIGFVPQYVIKPFLEEKSLKQINVNFEIPDIEYGFFVNKENISSALKEFIKLL